MRYTRRIREHIEIEDVKGANNKLADLEDLEEEIGCPLDVYVKATRNGYVYTNVKGICDYVDIEIFSNDTKTFFAKKGTTIWIMCEDYKKTWWLKEDKSE